VRAGTEIPPGAGDVELVSLTRHFGEVVAVDAISLKIGAGEFVTLLGPSGSGKTTTLMMIAGFVRPTAGEIMLGGRPITRKPAFKRNCNSDSGATSDPPSASGPRAAGAQLAGGARIGGASGAGSGREAARGGTRSVGLCGP